MKSAGSFHTDARLSASWKAPMFVAPSPKNATATWPVPRSRADQAAPAAIGRCPPTIPDEPNIPAEAFGQCLEPPLAPHRPVLLLISSARHSPRVAPPALPWWRPPDSA